MLFGREKSVDDGFGIVAFEPAVGGHGAVTGAMRASIHHDYAVARAKEQLGLAKDADAVVGNTVKEQHPAAVGICGPYFPAAQRDAVRSADFEILTMRADPRERHVSFLGQIRCEGPTDRMEESRPNQPAGNAGQQRRKDEQNQRDAN